MDSGLKPGRTTLDPLGMVTTLQIFSRPLFVWYDYFSCPQNEADSDQRELAISSFLEPKTDKTQQTRRTESPVAQVYRPSSNSSWAAKVEDAGNDWTCQVEAISDPATW